MLWSGMATEVSMYFQCGKCNVVFASQAACLNHGCWQNSSDQPVLVLPSGASNNEAEEDAIRTSSPIDSQPSQPNNEGSVRRFQWDGISVAELLSLLAEECRGDNLRGSNVLTKNKTIFEEVATRLQAKGYEVDAVSCDQKWRNLLRNYRIARKRSGSIEDLPHMSEVAAIVTQIGAEEEEDEEEEDVEEEECMEEEELAEEEEEEGKVFYKERGSSSKKSHHVVEETIDDDGVVWSDFATKFFLTLLEERAKSNELPSSSPSDQVHLEQIAGEMQRVIAQPFSARNCLAHWQLLCLITTEGNVAKGQDRFLPSAEVMQQVRRILAHWRHHRVVDGDDGGTGKQLPIKGSVATAGSPTGSSINRTPLATANVTCGSSVSRVSVEYATDLFTDNCVLKGFKWDNISVKELLRLIGERQTAGDFSRSGSKKKAVYAEIAEQLRCSGIPVDADACHQKWRNLVRDVKVAAVARRQGLNKHCPHFQAVVALMSREELSRALGPGGAMVAEGKAKDGMPSTAASEPTAIAPSASVGTGRKRKADVLEKIYELLKRDIEEERQFRELVLLRYEARQDALRHLLEEIRKLT